VVGSLSEMIIHPLIKSTGT